MSNELPSLRRYYQPVPFAEYGNVDPNRKDCELRWQAIRKHLALPSEALSMADVGCANGFFGFRFLQEGGGSVVGVERDAEFKDFINVVAERKNLKFTCVQRLVDICGTFGVCLYLDLHYHEGTQGYLEAVRALAPVAFISPSGIQQYDKRLQDELRGMYKNVELIYEGEYGRNIYRCE